MRSAGLENWTVWLGVEGDAPGFSFSRGSCFSFLTDLAGKPGTVKRGVLSSWRRGFSSLIKLAVKPGAVNRSPLGF